ncbi:MAG TPA: type II toxin-antitoxin system RelE/ParE family toxin [Bryobacteraceae bacterium]|jgi:phage-related protein|nr:type II toxin-antitoxin system RelE/ParE family toxin [Bryobacteraceae bacterium]
MPKSRVAIYRESDGSIPFVDWFRELPDQAKDKVLVRIERLRELGHELRRPEADFLRDGIYELRASARGIHYRVLYFFYKQVAAVVAHGLIKESAVPDREIDLAIRRRAQFEADPSKHTFEEK